MTQITAQHNLQQLTEHIRDWRSDDLLVDQAGRLVRNVALSGTDSKNGYRYSRQALRDAVGLYESKPVFLDHAANVSRPYERSTRDLAGSIVNPRFEHGRIRGDIQLLDTEAGRTLLALAETKNPAAGMSHVVLAERNREQTVVEKIHEVISVDAVVFPATPTTFRENAHQQAVDPLCGSLEAVLAEIDAALPAHAARHISQDGGGARRVGLYPDRLLIELCETDTAEPRIYGLDWRYQQGCIWLGEELTPVELAEIQQRTGGEKSVSFHAIENSNADPRIEGLQAQIHSLTDERDQLRAALEQLQQEKQSAEAGRHIERLLAESRLPECAVSDLFREQLLGAADDSTRRALIRERISVLERFSRPAPHSRERSEANTSSTSDAAIVAAIRGRRSNV